jgi:hypothetical protein
VGGGAGRHGGLPLRSGGLRWLRSQRRRGRSRRRSPRRCRPTPRTNSDRSDLPLWGVNCAAGRLGPSRDWRYGSSVAIATIDAGVAPGDDLELPAPLSPGSLFSARYRRPGQHPHPLPSKAPKRWGWGAHMAEEVCSLSPPVWFELQRRYPGLIRRLVLLATPRVHRKGRLGWACSGIALVGREDFPRESHSLGRHLFGMSSHCLCSSGARTASHGCGVDHRQGPPQRRWSRRTPKGRASRGRRAYSI